MTTKLTGINKIAVLRALGLGDFLAITPALYALREAYPHAEIVYLGKPWPKTFLEGRPGPIDRVIVVPVSNGVPVEAGRSQDEAELDAFFAQMREERFDLALQMHGGGRNSNPFVKRLGARFTAGTRTPDAPELDRWIPYIFYQHEIMRLLETVRLVGATVCSATITVPTLHLIARDFAEMDAKLPALRQSFAVLHPGSTDARRRWPPDRFAQVGDVLAQKGLQVIITGVDDEREVVDRVINLMQTPALNACDILSVGGLAALLSRAAILVSNDSGPMHVANAIGTPNVAIFWCGNMMNWSHFGRARHRPIPSWTVICPLCGADMTGHEWSAGECPHNVCFVDQVTVDQVTDAALDLLAYHSPRLMTDSA